MIGRSLQRSAPHLAHWRSAVDSSDCDVTLEFHAATRPLPARMESPRLVETRTDVGLALN